jgi:Skp family chaperone for outer membrane proteins
MKKFVTLMTLGLAMSVGSAFAASHVGAPMAGASAPKASASAPAMTKQQTKMGDCNAEAKEKNLKGDERKKFMSTCLKGASDAQKAQQAKMKSCNKDAGDKKLKGDERKKFMSSCLSA